MAQTSEAGPDNGVGDEQNGTDERREYDGDATGDEADTVSNLVGEIDLEAPEADTVDQRREVGPEDPDDYP